MHMFIPKQQVPHVLLITAYCEEICLKNVD
jgi:hypothetical protein